MSRWLVLFEDHLWRGMRPLTDLLPMSALAFGGSDVTTRWRAASGARLLATVGRRPVLDAANLAASGAEVAADGDEVVVFNAAALPAPWIRLVLDNGGARLWHDGERLAAARLPYARLKSLLGLGEEFGRALAALDLPASTAGAEWLVHPWDLITRNAAAIAADLGAIAAGSSGEVHASAVLESPGRIHIGAGARIEALAVLDARGGPISIGAGARIVSHTLVEGPCVIGERTELLGGRITRSTIGPECRLAGEVEDCIWQGYSNKRHHGFVGHSVIGEWVNLGALTTTSDLKNNYGAVSAWVDGTERQTGQTKVGSIIGAHVKTGIGTLLPTGASLGTGANLFGGGRFAPRRVPSFGWWDGEQMAEHRLEKFLGTARIAMSRRDRQLGLACEKLMRELFEATYAERRG
jgi:UDP-N-acetylglucosamine diphosphorylase/glucosamine-1-phosphate N-acetyltransferase